MRSPINGRRSAALVSAAVLAAATLSACSPENNDPVEQQAYCTDAEGEIVDCTRYDDDDSSIFIWYGAYPTGLRTGERLDTSRGTSIPYNDSAARTRVGLPASGPIVSGGKIGTTVKAPPATGTKVSGSKGGTGAGSGTGTGGRSSGTSGGS